MRMHLLSYVPDSRCELLEAEKRARNLKKSAMLTSLCAPSLCLFSLYSMAADFDVCEVARTFSKSDCLSGRGN